MCHPTKHKNSYIASVLLSYKPAYINDADYNYDNHGCDLKEGNTRPTTNH